MVRENELLAVLTEFADTMVTDFPIQAILDGLARRMVEILPVTAAGVTLINAAETPHYVAASDISALRFEQLQTELDQGPCLLAYGTGEAVAVPDLAADTQFPRFGPGALAAGMRAVVTFPLRHRDAQLGALDLYRDAPGQLDADDMVAAQTLANVTSAYLINAQSRQQAQELSDQFRADALHDALTGLPNRALLAQRLQHLALRAQRSHATAAVLFADLDEFKHVNDTHGHAAGDRLLIQVAHRLTTVMRPGDTLARVAGDEFVILCEDLADTADALTLAARIQVELAEPFDILPGTPITISASVGIAYAGPGEAVTQLIADADTAMFQAKRAGAAVHQVLDLHAAQAAADRHRLEIDLRTAQDTGQLALAYQPIVRTTDGQVTGVEALLRWQHPLQGPVLASTAIRIAERSGLITPIGEWVLEQACTDRTRWATQHPDRLLDLSVNVSGRQLVEPGFCATVDRILTATGMDPAALLLELTETVVIDDPQRARTVLHDLRTLGVRLALDDFGTGFCSLTYLHQFPIHMLKIDQSFIAKPHHDATALAIAAAVTDLAHVLGMTVTAEGVETEQQHHNVASIGCELAQGFLYAPPLTADELATHLHADSGRPLRCPPTPAPSGPRDQHAPNSPGNRRSSKDAPIPPRHTPDRGQIKPSQWGQMRLTQPTSPS